MIQIFFALLGIVSDGHAQSVTPGLWRADSSIEVVGFELPPSRDEKCVTASEAKDMKKTLTKELEHIGCLATKWSVKGNRLDVALKCTMSGLEAKGNIRGTVNPKNYELVGDATGTYQGIPTQATIKLVGKWTKDCTK